MGGCFFLAGHRVLLAMTATPLSQCGSVHADDSMKHKQITWPVCSQTPKIPPASNLPENSLCVAIPCRGGSLLGAFGYRNLTAPAALAHLLCPELPAVGQSGAPSSGRGG